MKKTTSVLLTLMMAISIFAANIVLPITTHAADPNYTFVAATGTITKYLGKGGNVVIPSTIDGVSVTSIGNDAFYQCTALTTLTIPTTVTKIGSTAFGFCRNLTSITIPKSVTSIGILAFSYCDSLTGIDVDSLNINYSSVDGVLFNKSKTNLIRFPGGKTGEYTIPNSVINIEISSFSNCFNISDITLSSNATSIGNSAFYSCNNLKNITIPRSVTSIGDEAFSECSSLTSINVDSTNTAYSSLDGVLFDKNKTILIKYPDCKSGAYTIPNSVTVIGNDAFFYCTGLTSITMGNSVITIGNTAFFLCTNLININLPNSIVVIGNSALRGCRNLISLTIPNSVINIGNDAFSSCANLTNIDVDSANCNYGSIDGVLFNKNKTTLIKCPGGKNGTYIIPDSVVNIGDSAFYSCENLTSIIMPNSVITIYKYAFTSCYKLKSITIPKNVTSIGEYAFAYNRLTSAIFEGNAPSTLGSNAFYYNDSSFRIYYKAGSSGFTTPTWNGYQTSVFSGYFVSFDVNGGNAILTQIGVTALPNPLPTPIKPGFTFVGWYKDINLTNAAVTGAIISTNTTLYAKWTLNTYSVTFNSIDGSQIANLSGVTALPNPLPTPIKPGFTFVGWYKNVSLTNAAVAGTVLSTNTELYAKWILNNYTVTFNSNGGSSVTSITAYYNSVITEPTTPIYDGFVFAGWYKETELSTPWNFSIDSVTNNIILYAKWTSSISAINIGDYVLMGKYNNDQILWRCVDIDENGPLMLSDKIISIKPFDAAGNHKYIDGTTQVDYNNSRTYNGSDLWETSNMRSWLNSTATSGNVIWLDGCPPIADNVYNGWNAYSDEKGFLIEDNFTAIERVAIKSVTQKSLLNSLDITKLKIDGTAVHTYNPYISTVIQNYDLAYYHNVTDKMFLLDVKQVNKVYQNRSILGTSYHIGQPTQKAVDNSTYNNNLNSGENCHYWLRSPSADSYGSVRNITKEGYVSITSAYISYALGVRPAFYINLTSVIFTSGDGSVGNPYKVNDDVIWQLSNLANVNNTISVNVSNDKSTYHTLPIITVAVYDENDNLIYVIDQPVEENKTSYNFDVTGISGIKKIKAFLWDSLDSPQPHPLTEQLEYDVN